MNFALMASIVWLFSIPEKEDAKDYAVEQLINGGNYIIQNEADASILYAYDPGKPGFRPGYVNTTKWRLANTTKWALQYFKDNRFFTVRSLSLNNSHNEVALVLEQSKDGKQRPDTYNRYWNITFVGRSYGFDKWIIIDFGKGASNSNSNTGKEKCLENQKKGQRIKLADCDKTNRRQRWRFCLCSLPPLPKGVPDRDRVIERIS